MITFSRQQNIIVQLIVVLIILVNSYWLHSPVVGIIFAPIYLWLNSKKLADIFYPKIHRGLKNALGLILIITYISLIYTLAYHIYQMNIWIFFFLLLSIPIIIEILSFRSHSQHYYLTSLDLAKLRLSNTRNLILPAAVFLIDLVLFIALFKKASLGLIRSPWEILNYKFWALFILSNILLVVSILHKKTSKNILLISWHFLLISSIAIIIYKLGYGYDSFIHQTALNIINDTGTIQPRLWLYVGQYGISLFFHQISQVSLETTNKLLLPISFGLIWPSGVFYGLRYGFKWSFKASYLSTLWSTFVGIGFAIMTTPQSFSYLLVAFIVFILPEINRKKISLYFPWAVAAMAMTIHPLSGIPLLSLSAILSTLRIKKRAWIKNTIFTLVLILSSLILPLLLAVYQKISGFSWSQILSVKLWPLFDMPNIGWYSSYSFPLDMIHNIGSNMIWLYLLTVLLGLLFILKEHKLIFFRRHLLFAGILLINYLVARIFLSFNLQIDYQKFDYINRILFLIALTILPIFLTSFYFLFKDTIKKDRNIFQKAWIVVVTVVIVSSSVYFAYPTYDRHSNSKSINVTKTDIETVNLIDDYANGAPYIVLSNQMVGVAAISEFGFAHYYNDNFYYSMPLGVDNIYQNYLNMIEKNASREEAIAAMDKTNVDQLYFVVNNYWRSAKQAINQATLTADEKILVGNGISTVFIYQR
jgi:hypothetical protein